MEKSKLSGARHWLTGSLAPCFEVPPFSSCPGRSGQVCLVSSSYQSSSFPSFPVQPAFHFTPRAQTRQASFRLTSTPRPLPRLSSRAGLRTPPPLPSFDLSLSRISHFNPHAPQCGLRFRPPINRFLRCPVLSCPVPHPAVDYLTSNCILQPPHYSTSTIARTACTKRSTRPSLYDRNEYCPLLSPLSVAQSDPGFNSID